MTTLREIFLGLALLLLVAGAIGHQWVISEQTSEQQLLSQQQEQLKTRVTEAGKVLDRELNVRPFSGEIAGENLQDEPAGKEPAVRSNVRIISFVCLGAGITISAGWLIAVIVYYVSTGLRNLKKFSFYIVRRLKELCRVELIKGFLKKCKKTLREIILG